MWTISIIRQINEEFLGLLCQRGKKKKLKFQRYWYLKGSVLGMGYFKQVDIFRNFYFDL